MIKFKGLILCLLFCITFAYSQWIDAYIPDFKVNDDNLNSYQTNSDIGVDSSGNFVIVWRDVRNNQGFQSPAQIYCQRYNREGLALGTNFRIGHDSTRYPKITALEDGRFIVSWIRNFRLGNITMFDFYFQRFDNAGQPLNIPIRVVDTFYINADETIQGYTIACNTTGNFLITWDKGKLNDTSRIYFQRYDSTGGRIGSVQRVNESNSNVEFPQVAINNDGSFVIVWQDNRNNITYNKYDIYMQRYDASANKIGNNIKVNDDTDPLTQQLGGDVSTDKNGYTVVAWQDERFSPIDGIFYQLYEPNGQVIGSNRRADISFIWYSTGSARVSMRNDGKFYIGWLDRSYADKDQVYGRRFDSLGNPIGMPYMIPASSPGSSTQTGNTLYLLGDRVYTSWTDNRNGGTVNYDIYCNVRGFQNPDTVIGIYSTTGIAIDYKLYPVFPNPFNPETNLQFTIAKYSFVTITLYDITGKEVTHLLKEFRNPGEYRILWKANTLPSGIYFIEMRTNTGYREVQKGLLIK